MVTRGWDECRHGGGAVAGTLSPGLRSHSWNAETDTSYRLGIPYRLQAALLSDGRNLQRCRHARTSGLTGASSADSRTAMEPKSGGKRLRIKDGWISQRSSVSSQSRNSLASFSRLHGRAGTMCTPRPCCEFWGWGGPPPYWWAMFDTPVGPASTWGTRSPRVVRLPSTPTYKASEQCRNAAQPPALFCEQTSARNAPSSLRKSALEEPNLRVRRKACLQWHPPCVLRRQLEKIG